MTESEFRGILALSEKRDQIHYAWLRQLIVLASGALTVLVSFGTGKDSSGVALVCIRVAWIALGSGILLCATALHCEVWTARNLIKRAVELEERADSASKVFGLSTAVVRLPLFYRLAERLCYCALTIAVGALVCFAVYKA